MFEKAYGNLRQFRKPHGQLRHLFLKPADTYEWFWKVRNLPTDPCGQWHHLSPWCPQVIRRVKKLRILLRQFRKLPTVTFGHCFNSFPCLRKAPVVSEKLRTPCGYIVHCLRTLRDTTAATIKRLKQWNRRVCGGHESGVKGRQKFIF